MLYQSEPGYNTAEIRICCAKNKGTVDRSTVTRWLKKFRSGCKNLDDQAISGRPKLVDSEAIFQIIVANA